MNTTTRSSTAERFGRWLGRGWRSYSCAERRVSAALAYRGIPAGVATGLLWAVKLTALVVLLYVAFWLALLLVFLVLVAHGYDTVDAKESEPEWRYGHSGYGLYTSDGHRIDQHDPNDPHNN